jgi:hypothetical protein
VNGCRLILTSTTSGSITASFLTDGIQASIEL